MGPDTSRLVAMNEHNGTKNYLNSHEDVYKILFEQAPFYITVLDRDLKLVKYNHEFAHKFSGKPGDYCFKAYKGRSEQCEPCPVLKTFKDGRPHCSEETGIGKDGSRSHWLVKSAPVRNEQGEIVAAIEMCLDLTPIKQLEKEVQKSEEKYRTIFNSIPNPVFVLDRNTLNILDCNNSVTAVYGFQKEEITDVSFLDFFMENEREDYQLVLRTCNFINQVKHRTKDGRTIFVKIRVSSSDYQGREALLVTTSDLTEQLLAEQQLIQSSKMATLGEMATGVAHELNQPLSVIKTASSFLNKKIMKSEEIPGDVLKTLAEEIDIHVDRATKIINHMREFGRKADASKEEVHINEPLTKALDFFMQQLKLHQIGVRKDLADGLPPISADANRLEQVFINLLLNARDAVEEKWKISEPSGQSKRIVIRSYLEKGMVVVEFGDNGIGMHESIRDKIFEPFFTTKNVGVGTGLGLAISYGIVQSYEGVIQVETKEGVGSTFIIKFPGLG